MSDTRLELVEPCEHGERNNCGVGPHCLECPGTESCFNGVPLHRWCPGGSRRVLSVPTEEMIEAVALSLHFAGEGERSSGYYQDLASEALTAAFNSLDIQEKVE